MNGHINLLSRVARINGVASPALSKVSGSPVTDNFGRILVERPTVNQQPNPTCAGAAVGSVVGGPVNNGLLPTNFKQTVTTCPCDVLPAPPGWFRFRWQRFSATPATAAPAMRTALFPGFVPSDISRGGIAASFNIRLADASPNVSWVQVTLAAYTPDGTLQRRSDVMLPKGAPVRRRSLWVPVNPGEDVLLSWAATLSGPTASTDQFFAVIDVKGDLQAESASGPDDTTSFVATSRNAPQTVSVTPALPSTSMLLQTNKGGRWVTGPTLPAADSYAVEQINLFGTLDPAAKNAIVDQLHPPEFDHSPLNGDIITFEGMSVEVQRPPGLWTFGIAKNRKSLCRMEIRPGDRWPGDDIHVPVNTNQRCEINTQKAQPVSGDVWLSMGLKVEPGLPTTLFKIMGQFFTQGDVDANGQTEAHPPTWTQQLLANDLFVVYSRGDANPITVSNPPLHTAWTMPNFARGVWHQLVHRLTFSTTGGGYLKSWHNGIVVYDAAIPLGFNNQIGCYFKHGLYCGLTNDTIAVQYANVEVGPTDLSDRVLNPLPIA